MLRILASDIGGTSSRFRFFSVSGRDLEPGDSVTLDTASAASLPDLLAGLQAEGLDPAGADALVLAVPGPVERGTFARAANIDWHFDLAELDSKLAAKTHLINDFVAQGYAARTRSMEASHPVKDGAADPEGALAVIGAGTGLGYSVTLPGGEAGFLAVASEGGHMAFPFVGDEEEAFHVFLRRERDIPYAYGDAVVSGSGLAALHAFLTGRKRKPREVAAEIGPDSETTRLFARFYARAARNWTLATAALGGVVLSGGVAAKNPFLVDNDAFREEFVSSPSYPELLRDIPVRLNRDEEAGLWGAALYGAQRAGLGGS
ncbi:glucokinase [Desulfohalovibrio reitneri]|uniref:glucokinase n=1 Tax=Desulfohalovibrio reitneri TaxID=1307759 RepID=UPI000555335F|nr:glucokinase [Desulfohalovibrio reitneri]